jgi:phage tail protein X
VAPAAKPTLSPEQQLRKAVAFLNVFCPTDPKNPKIGVSGTGFFLTYTDAKMGNDVEDHYLVTNRHIAECWDENNKPRPVQKATIMVNLASGSVHEFLLGEGRIPWFFPVDPSVDLAIMPLTVDHSLVDYLSIPSKGFLVDESPLSEGQRILFSGLFVRFPGIQKVQPIVREGTLAMVPDEKLTTTTGQPGKLYLGDVHVFHGNSGSPVLVDLKSSNPGVISASYYLLLGVVSGVYPEDDDFEIETASTLKGTLHANSGIAMIVPALSIKALLEQPDVQVQRDEEVNKYQREHKTDSTPPKQ